MYLDWRSTKSVEKTRLYGHERVNGLGKTRAQVRPRNARKRRSWHRDTRIRFRLKTQLFLYRLAFQLVSGEDYQRKGNFSKTRSRVNIFENTVVVVFSWGTFRKRWRHDVEFIERWSFPSDKCGRQVKKGKRAFAFSNEKGKGFDGALAPLRLCFRRCVWTIYQACAFLLEHCRSCDWGAINCFLLPVTVFFC